MYLKLLNHNSKIYVDTSAFYALIDRSDRNHSKASALWREFLEIRVILNTTNYIVLETLKLLQKRIGFEAANLWYRDILGVIDIFWVDADLHQRAYELWLSVGRKRIGIVDCISFVAMHHHQIEKTFCFKSYYRDYGFNLVTLSSVR